MTDAGTVALQLSSRLPGSDPKLASSACEL